METDNTVPYEALHKCADLIADFSLGRRTMGPIEVILELDGIICAALDAPATTENRRQLATNAAAMREALLEARHFVWASAQRTDCDLLVTGDEKRGQYGPYVLSPKDTIMKIDAALSAPARNCDVGTAEEQIKRQYDTMCNTTKACPDSDWACKKCFAEWAQMPYEAGCAK